MPVVPFPPYAPDLSDYEATNSRNVLNVVPRADGYGPFPSLAAISLSLGAQCRGAFAAYKTDASVVVFASTATDLYLMSNTTFAWSKVSLAGGPYPALSNGDMWVFRQFNNLVFATQANAVLQVFNVATSLAFANALGNPPQARYMDVVGKFLVLNGLLSNPNRVQWSGLNDVNSANSWTAGLNSSDLQDLSDGGFCRGIAGGESGVILQDTIIRAMTYLPGSPIVFQIRKIAEEVGIYGPYSLVRSGPTLFFYSLKGFHRIDPGGVPVPIGRERVDRTFFTDLDAANLQLFQGIADPRSSRILWAYKSVNGVVNQFDKMLCYDPVLDKFTPIVTAGECLLQLSQPGITLEGLDAIAPGAMPVLEATNNGAGLVRIRVASTAMLFAGQYASLSKIVGTTEANGNFFINIIDATHFDLLGSAFANAYVSGGLVAGQLDLMTQSLDSFPSAIIPELAAFDPGHMLNFFRGPSLEATLETAEQGTDGRRIKIRNGFRPISDARAIFGSCSRRENLQSPAAAGAESPINPITGICNMLVDTRYGRFKARVPSGTVWTFINGVEPDMIATGKR